MSSPGQEPSFPMTPASTPESSDGMILKQHTENQSQSVSTLAVQTDDGVIASTPDESKAKSVAVGVNTGVSLLWNEPPQNTSRCLRCCECNYRYNKYNVFFLILRLTKILRDERIIDSDSIFAIYLCFNSFMIADFWFYKMFSLFPLQLSKIIILFEAQTLERTMEYK